jgi:DNA-binding protein H-NS
MALPIFSRVWQRVKGIARNGQWRLAVAEADHAVTAAEGADESFTHTARTLIDFTTLPEGSLLRVVKAGLRELSADSLEQVEREARALRETRQAEEVQLARATLTNLARKTGLGPADLFPDLVPATGTRKPKTGAKVRVKYRGPGGQEWSGRGIDPTWLTDLLKAGHQKSEFEVKPDAGQGPSSG